MVGGKRTTDERGTAVFTVKNLSFHFPGKTALFTDWATCIPPGITLVRGGDVLVAEDGSMVKVIAAPQPVLRITACTAGSFMLSLS